MAPGLSASVQAQTHLAKGPHYPPQTLGFSDNAPTKAAKVQPSTFSEQYGVQMVPIPQFRLGPVDVPALTADDEKTQQRMGNVPLRIGVGREVGIGLPTGQWQEVIDGQLWRVDVTLDDAMAMRLHFAGFNLPRGSEVAVYSLDDPDQPPCRFAETGPTGAGEFWTPNLFGSHASIEYFLPSDQLNNANQMPFLIDEVQHIYRDIYNRGGEGGIASAGSCNLIPACYPAWTSMRNAIGRITFVSGGSTFLCSGTLIATQNNDQTPYFLTANHCIGTNAEAQTATIDWRYESTQCTPPNPMFGPSSSICTMVSTYLPSDETLLMVDGALPSGMFWAGWVAGAQPTNLLSTCLHHPSGDYMRISFCTQFTNANCNINGQPLTNWCRAHWSAGVTEGGSSGSGLFRNDTQQLYATLTCGASSCANPTGDDSYGRFAPAYSANFSGPLAAGSDDAFEPNNTCATAVTTASGTYNNLIVKSTAEDWYRINIPGGATLSASLSFTDANGDIDMQLYNSCGGSVVAQSTGSGNTESVNYTNSGATADFFLRVFLFSDTRNTYSMTLAFGPPTNNNCASATVAPAGSINFSTIGATTDGPNEPGGCNFNGYTQIGNDIWYLYPAQCTGTATISLCGSNFDTKLAVYGAACPGSTSGLTIACNDNFCGDDAQVSFPVTSGQIYRVRIGGFNGATGSGTMVITCTPPAQTGACCLPNGTCQGNVSQANCQASGGTYQGNNTTCGGVSCPQPCPADVNGNHVVNVDDLLAIIKGWGACPQPCPPYCNADVNHTCAVNVDDLLAVINAWGPCP